MINGESGVHPFLGKFRFTRSRSRYIEQLSLMRSDVNQSAIRAIMAAAVEKAYEAIRSAILSGIHPAGRHLKAADLAEDLGVSRTPVREAMRRLHAEGLVNFVANHGAYVMSWSSRDIEEIFSLRSVLESHAAEQAARYIQPIQLAELRQLTDQMDEFAARRQAVDYLDCNDRFHKLILEAAGNHRLSAMVGSIIEVPLVHNTFARYDHRNVLRSNSQHRELVDAFSAGDSTWAASVMRSHILAARQVFLAGEGVFGARTAAE